MSALLSFLRGCPRDSSEQYLALLVLNNLSIPVQNKRVIALECDGAKVLGRMLCEDPGCHLLAIVIVNLTFGDEELNRDLLTMGRRRGGGEEVQLVDCLGYALLVSSFFGRRRSSSRVDFRATPMRQGEESNIYIIHIYNG